MMPLYIYKAMDSQGNRIKSKIELNSQDEVTEYVKSKGLIPIEVKKSKFFSNDICDLVSFKTKLSVKSMSVFSKKLSFLLHSGVGINKSLAIIGSQHNNGLNQIINNVNYDIIKGSSLYEALNNRGTFSKFYINMIRIGEESGKLPEILDKLADFYETQLKIIEEVKAALIYPCIVSVMMLIVIVCSLIFVVPNYITMFLANDMLLPLPTRLLVDLSNFLIHNLSNMIIGAFIIIFIILYFVLYKTKTIIYVIDFFKLNLYLISKVYIKILNLRFSQALSILLDSGVNIIRALEIIKPILANKIVVKEMNMIISKTKQGNSILSSMEDAKYFDAMLFQMIQIGEESGNLSKTMFKCSKYFEDELNITVVRLTKLIEPIITISLGVILAFIMLAIMLPTFYMANVI